jgi:ankyrin repeat protein
MNQVRLVILCAMALCLGVTAAEQTSPESATPHALSAAIRGGDVKVLESVLAAGVNPNSSDTRGITPLMTATALGSLDHMRVLIARGADVNARTKAGVTPLMWAVHDVERVRLLLAHGADPTAVAVDGRTALTMAVTSRPAEPVVRALLGRNVDAAAVDTRSGFNAAVGALIGADASAAALLRDALGDVNVTGKGQRDGYTPLMLAAGVGNVQAATALLGKGAHVNARSAGLNPANRVRTGQVQEGGYTAVMLAAAYGPPTLVRALLDAGADVNASDVRGMTPLMLAVSTDRLDPAIVRDLLARGADRSAKSGAGETALDWARKYGHAEVIAMLGGTPAEVKPIVLNPTPPAGRIAVARSVELLERSGNRFFATAGCYACHAQTAAQIAQAAARATRVPFDESAAQEFTRQLITAGMPPTAFIPEAMAQRQIAAPTSFADQLLYLFEGLARNGYPPNTMTDFVAARTAADQGIDGGWHRSDGLARTPLEDGDFARTAMAMRVLRTYALPARAREFAERLQRAKAWLLRERPVITEDWAMRLQGAAAAGLRADERRTLAAPLLRLQRADGGWSQREGLPSDAYATGLALTALAESEALPTSASEYQRGVRFLLGTQAPDGSWHVVSRAAKIQPYFESGFPYGHDQWISSMGTAWAANAIALALGSPRPVD